MKWIIPSCALAVVLGLVLTMPIPAQTITPDASTLKLFPVETRGVAYIDVAGLRGAPLVQDFLAEVMKKGYPEKAREFIEKTGFDPVRDLERVTIGRIGDKEMLAVVNARLDRIRLEQYANEKHAASETYLGRVIFSEDDHALSFVDDAILAGSLQGVKQAIDRLAAPAPNATQNDALMRSIRTIEAGSQVWAAGEFSSPLGLDRGVPAPARDAMNALKGGTYQMRVDRDVHARAVGEFSDADRARSLGDLARGLLAVAKLQVAQQQDFMQLLDSVRIENAGTAVTVTFDASGELLKKMQNARPAFRRGN